MSDPAGIVRSFPSPPLRPWKQATLITLDDLMRMLAPLTPEEPREHVVVRGPVFAVGMDWLVRLPAGKAKDAAIERLAEAAELACAAYDLAE